MPLALPAALLLLLCGLLASVPAARPGPSSEALSAYQSRKVEYRPLEPRRDKQDIVIFVHAAVGIFKKKRGSGFWGYGSEILTDLLQQVRRSGLGQKVAAICVTLLGKDSDR